MNVCFAVQEMNVPMSQYIESPITLLIVQLRLVRWPVGTMSPNCFNFSVLFLYAVITDKLPFFWRLPKKHLFPLTANAILIKPSKTNQIYFHPLQTNPRFSWQIFPLNESTQCLLTEISFDKWEWCMIAWKWASKCIFYFRKLVSCKIRVKKKIYICYVLYMVCIVFVKMNQTMFYRKTFLYEDV